MQADLNAFGNFGLGCCRKLRKIEWSAKGSITCQASYSGHDIVNEMDCKTQNVNNSKQ